jgi:hypothetical protein
MPRSKDEYGKHRHPPPLLRALARRLVRVLLAASPHLPQWIRQTTHHPPQPHKPLLVGTTMYAANAPPTPSLTSHCSWGGTWVGRWCPPHRTTRHPPQPHEPLLVGWITGGTTMHAAPRIEQRTTHPQPHKPLLVGWRLEATTAHCYSTHNHCHEPLLVGGKGCYARGGAWQGVFSTGIQWNSWIPGSLIGIGGGV